jgi:YhcH/YjgK/YiaL family protein
LISSGRSPEVLQQRYLAIQAAGSKSDRPGRRAARGWLFRRRFSDTLAPMIIDRLENTAATKYLAPRLREGLEWLRNRDLDAVPEGRLDIDGDRLFALVQEYTTRDAAECRWEAHRKYTDIQYVMRGTERMGFTNISHTRETDPYDPARDVAFFEAGMDFITVHAGMFAIFAPEDVHAPCGAVGAPAVVRKIVLKVAGESS